MENTAPLVGLSVTPEIAAQSIRNWNHALRAGHPRMSQIFELYEGFTIEAGTLPPGGDDFHVYVGLDTDADSAKLEFFMVHAQYDNPVDIIVPGRIMRYDGRPFRPANPEAFDPIPDDEGARRILNWSLNNQNWVTSVFNEDRALFQCWHVPLSDVDRVEDSYKIYFGLVVSAGSTESDLIIQRVGTIPNFYDLVRPVPPFKSGEMTEYHLLMTALR